VSPGQGARLRVLLTDSEDEGTETEHVPPTAPARGRTGVNGPSKCDPYIGRRLANKYELESLLGSGSAGAVYRATHLGLRRPVAVKVLHERHRRSPQTVGRFKAEALLASRLDHPNVMRVLDSGQEPDGTLYLVMEFVEGKTLGALIAEQVRLSPDRAVNIAIQIASALVVAHAAGIVHRDVKPENIIVLEDRDDAGRSSDRAKVGDFGIAKIFDRDAGAADLTGVGVILGSPVYIAPEQIRGRPCDERTDIYAVAVTLFEMLTGRLPHEGDNVTELFKAKLNAAPTRLSTFLPNVDALLEDIVMRALESDPELRHASASELRTELIEALKELQSAPLSTNAVSIWPERHE
jgi:serine/threonine-protein kinase